MGRAKDNVRHAIALAFEKAKKHRLIVEGRWSAFVLICVALAAFFLFLYWNNPHFVNLAAVLLPTAFSLLLAFVPDLRKAHLFWRLGIVVLGLIGSAVLWKKDAFAAIALEEIKAVTTGGDSYPVISPVLGKIDDQPGMPLVIVVEGVHNMYDATITVIPHVQAITSLPKEELLGLLLHPQSATLAMVPTNPGTILNLRVDPQGEEDRYGVRVVARNGQFAEDLRLTKDGATYRYTGQVRDALTSRVLLDFPK